MIMSEQDIIEDLGAGILRTTIIQAIEITRQGQDGGWRVSLPLTRSIELPDGSVVTQATAPKAYDLADLVHDPAVAKLYDQLRDVTLRIVRGDLAPLPDLKG